MERNVTNVTNAAFKPHFMVFILNVALTISLNIIVLIVLRHQKCLHDAMRTLYNALACSDMVLGVVWNSWAVVWYGYNSPVACEMATKLFMFVFRLTTLSSMLCLCGISFTMLMLISKPLLYHRVMTERNLKVGFVVFGVVSVCICCLYLPIPESPFIKVSISECLNHDRDQLAYPWYAALQLSSMLLTLVFTTSVNVVILKIACKQRKTVANLENQVIGHMVEGPYPPAVDRPPFRPPSKSFKGVINITLNTASILVLWFPSLVYYAISQGLGQQVLETVSCCTTWVRPAVYLMTYGNAMKSCRRSLPCDWSTTI